MSQLLASPYSMLKLTILPSHSSLQRTLIFRHSYFTR